MRLDFTEQEIAEIAQALYHAAYGNVLHERVRDTFMQRVEQAKAQSEVQDEVRHLR